jgi:hypothetical protein
MCADEEGSADTLAYSINADDKQARPGVDRTQVGFVNALRGVRYLLYESDGTHSNFLQTLRALKKEVDGAL